MQVNTPRFKTNTGKLILKWPTLHFSKTVLISVTNNFAQVSFIVLTLYIFPNIHPYLYLWDLPRPQPPLSHTFNFDIIPTAQIYYY